MVSLMTRELEEIAWKRELAARTASGHVFDETREEALHSLAFEILDGYEKRDKCDVHQWVAGLRNEIPTWMTWPMLMEWAQRVIAKLKTQPNK